MGRMKLHDACGQSSAFSLLTDEAGLTFACLDAEEAQFLYEEIFVSRAYFQEGVALPLRGAPVVIDAGANIGLFSLLCLRLNPHSRVFAFEPSPDTFALLERNLSAYASAECLRLALGARRGESTIYCYASAPGESSRHPRERAMQQARLRDYLAATPHVDAPQAHGACEADTRAHACTVLPLAEQLREAGVRHVDLLKIDVEGDEMGVLLGLGSLLRVVQQVAVEVHDIHGRLWRVLCLLRRHGFRATARAQSGGVVEGYETVVPPSLRLWYVHALRQPRRSPRFRSSAAVKVARSISASRAVCERALPSRARAATRVRRGRGVADGR
mmetsp:Transcript_8270/g.18137  ORF Transcript_8270/g.18137 Transcript_8270/m.18137 type:complete len:329 (-) Transcript_8270:325-1311(-)